MKNFIDDLYIKDLLEESKATTKAEVYSILEKAQKLEGLNHIEVAKLLEIKTDECLEKLFEVAGEIKSKIYGNRVVLFAPLYISDFCRNNCTYCGYKRDNEFHRSKLTKEGIIQEVKSLEKLGHKRIALEVGEDERNCSFDYILDSIDWIYEAGDIRRINVNVAATTLENYRKLKEKEIGTYILFQETYNKEIFEKVHPKSLKGDYDRQLFAHHRAMEAGIDDVGGGVLFGLSDYKYEVIGLMLHNESLEKEFHVGFHTISVPRLKQAEGVDMCEFPNVIDDFTFKKIVAILRLACPYTGIILSTRETPQIRELLIDAGVTQVSAGSITEVGGYESSLEEVTKEIKQFELSDERTPMEVIKNLIKLNKLPSYCTACYRRGRTGEVFMDTVKAGKINLVCQPNAIMTLTEYIEDFGDDELKQVGYKFIEKQLETIPNQKIKKVIKENIEKIKKGERDLYL